MISPPPADGEPGQDGKDGSDGKDGTDGKDGQDGVPGKDGANGLQGMIYRTSEWVAGIRYRNDINETFEPRFIDVVTIMTGNSLKAYQCKPGNHLSTIDNKPTGDTETAYWKPFNMMENPIYTSLIMAPNSIIRFMQGQQLLIQDDNGEVVAGMSARGDISFWVGYGGPDNAPVKYDRTVRQFDVEGVINATNGVLDNVLVKGSVKTPFTDGYYRYSDDGSPISVSTYGLQNNNCVVIPGTDWSARIAFNVPFTNDCNGFRATILNTAWGGKPSVGQIAASAPSGYYFHENGEMLSQLIINPNEGVDMIGVGEGTAFRGWLIMNRFSYGIGNSSTGTPLKYLFMGKVEFSGGIPSLVGQDRYNRYFPGAENKRCQLSYRVDSPHYCTINFPSGTFTSRDDYAVVLTGEKIISDLGAGVYASVIKREADYFTVYTGDDDSWNDGNFTYIVTSKRFWEKY